MQLLRKLKIYHLCGIGDPITIDLYRCLTTLKEYKHSDTYTVYNFTNYNNISILLFGNKIELSNTVVNKLCENYNINTDEVYSIVSYIMDIHYGHKKIKILHNRSLF